MAKYLVTLPDLENAVLEGFGLLNDSPIALFSPRLHFVSHHSVASSMECTPATVAQFRLVAFSPSILPPLQQVFAQGWVGTKYVPQAARVMKSAHFGATDPKKPQPWHQSKKNAEPLIE